MAEEAKQQHETPMEEEAVTKGGPEQLLLGLVFGVIFGFLLQKGGVAKFEILIGVLLLRDFTVIKVMVSAIIVGMIGVYAMHSLGWVKLSVKPTKYLSNVIGGLLFGVGFALAAYCPGTGAAALGQGNFDAIAVMLGLMAGAYVFALTSGWTQRKLDPVGKRGELTWPELLHAKRWVFIPIFAVVLAAALAVLEQLG